MPNHVTTVCYASGTPEDVERFRTAHFRAAAGGDLEFAFDTIIPKPDSIKATESGSQADLGFYALTGLCGYLGILPPPGYSGPMRHEDLAAWLENNHPHVLAKGRAALAAFRETGHRDWYEWSCANWGTKWGAYDVELRPSEAGWFCFKFKTAWSFPEPVFRKLASLHPGIVFKIVSFDEGWNFGAEGEFNGADDYHTVRPGTADLYRRVYGKDPEKDEDEEETEAVH